MADQPPPRSSIDGRAALSSSSSAGGRASVDRSRASADGRVSFSGDRKLPTGPSADAVRASFEAPRPSIDRPVEAVGAPSKPKVRPSIERPRPSIENHRPSIDTFRTSLDVPRQFEEIKQRMSIADKDAHLPPRESPGRKKELEAELIEKKGAAKEYHADEHKMTLQQLAAQYETNIDFAEPVKSKGLTSTEAAKRLASYGPNRLTPPKETPEILKFLHHFIDPFMVLLEIAAILCYILFAIQPSNPVNLYVAVVLCIIVLLNSIMGYYQERQSGKLMDSFKNLLPQQCKVVRDGFETIVPADEVVPGDVVMVKAGDKVPADIRIIQSDGLKVDNSSLTGENEPQPRTINLTNDNPLETQNLAFYSSLAVEGTSAGIAIRTGDNTLIGQIASLSTTTKAVKTTLEREILRFVIFIASFAGILGAIFFAINVGLHPDLIAVAVLNTIGILVANVPEGLPTTVGMCLKLTTAKLAKRQVFVKKPQCVETLGSTSVIASDKTGTLTQNKMTAVHTWTNNVVQDIKIRDKADLTAKYDPNSAPQNWPLMRVACLCSRAKFEAADTNPDPLTRRVLADASETAIFRFCESALPAAQTREQYPKIFEIPFNSTIKYQLSIHQQKDKIGSSDYTNLLAIKGAPEIIWGKCSKIMFNGKEEPITEEWCQLFQQTYEQLAGGGERVLGFATTYLQDPHDAEYNAETGNFDQNGYTFLGMISLMDPPKEGVDNAVAKCRTAGIRVVMVTGDHPLTARAIAKQIGIITLPTIDEVAKQRGCAIEEVSEQDVKAIVVPGQTLKNFTPEQWDITTSKLEIVFARTSPQQKLQIVEHFQAKGEIVAVTGDGVNDSPALKKSDIGVAMGVGGSDVAKDAASIILMDDNFCSIVNAVEEGRVIFDNLKKSIAYTLSHLLPELIPFLLNVILGLPLALAPLMILCVDCGTEMAPAICLAYESTEADIMKRKPRNVKTDHLVTPTTLGYSYLEAGIFETGACLTVYFWVMKDLGWAASDIMWQGDYFVVDADPLYHNGKLYDDSDQLDVLKQAQTGYFLALVYMQVINLLCCRTRVLSIFTHGFRNKHINFALIFEICLMVVFVFVPGIKYVLGFDSPTGAAWALPLPFCAGWLAITEIRKLWTRHFPSGIIAKLFAW